MVLYFWLQGMCLLTLAVSLPGLRPPACAPGVADQDCPQASSLQVGIFFVALYIIAAGTGGTKPNISTMGADQFDEFEPKERSRKLSFYNWWVFYILIGTISAQTLLVYIQDRVGFGLGYGIPTVALAVSIFMFLLGTPLYRHRLPSGSPLTRMVQVLVSEVRKWKVHVPHDLNQLHELSMEEYYASKGRTRIYHSSSLRLVIKFFLFKLYISFVYCNLTNVCRFLDKAAVKTGETSPWMLCTVTQIEETKQMMKMVPILITTCIPSTVIAQTTTLFIRQGTTLDRRMGPHFEIPPACLIAFVNIFMLISVVIYDRLFVPAIRHYTKNPRGISLLQRLGIGLVLHVIIMLTACFVERKRLSVAREKNLLGQLDKIPLTIFILLPQFAFTGIADTFVDVAKLEFFYDQAPEAMKSLGTSYFTTTLSIGNFLNSFLLSTVADLTRKHGHKSWILDNLNASRLDYYYAFLALLSAINFFCFVAVAKLYVYNVDQTQINKDLDMNTTSPQANTEIGQSTTTR
ncbi:protein NRT1/ PTR FAMILY 5.2 [Vigna angularis]|uniref:protein NRT1/ PTR FAMILY 5.2 n=1 Tax=Phaseolus angularis TaxID=3914 RepID=UPI000809FDFB|nr:protein NRT1/ PTR FAMILY 5.2 [Vigna angularis]